MLDARRSAPRPTPPCTPRATEFEAAIRYTAAYDKPVCLASKR